MEAPGNTSPVLRSQSKSPNPSRFKVVAVGDQYIGKTTLFFSFDGIFRPTKTRTHGSGVYDCELDVEGNSQKLRIYDTAGDPAERKSIENYFLNAALFMAMWEANKPASIDSLQQILKSAQAVTQNKLPFIVFVRTKSEKQLEGFPKESERIREIAKELGLEENHFSIVQVSAKTGQGLEELKKIIAEFLGIEIRRLLEMNRGLWDKISHSREVTRKKLKNYFNHTPMGQWNVQWLLMVWDALNDSACRTSLLIKEKLLMVLGTEQKFLEHVTSSPRLKAGVVVELLQLLEKEERDKLAKAAIVLSSLFNVSFDYSKEKAGYCGAIYDMAWKIFDNMASRQALNTGRELMAAASINVSNTETSQDVELLTRVDILREIDEKYVTKDVKEILDKYYPEVKRKLSFGGGN